MTDQRPGTPGTLESLRIYVRPRMLSMLALGFSSGLPFMLIYSTLSAWLSQSGIERATIGMLSWVSLVYTLKFLWSPVVDRLRLPLIGRAARSAAQLDAAGAGSIARRAAGAYRAAIPGPDVLHVAMLALWLAFSAATQDIAIDAWRIESAPVREQGAMAAAYQLGYRLAILVGQAGALWIADDLGLGAQLLAPWRRWSVIGVLTTLLVREPQAHRAAGLGADRAARDRLAGASRALARLAAPRRRLGSRRRACARCWISLRATGWRSGC